jgi:hypothetical protein
MSLCRDANCENWMHPALTREPGRYQVVGVTNTKLGPHPLGYSYATCGWCSRVLRPDQLETFEERLSANTTLVASELSKISKLPYLLNSSAPFLPLSLPPGICEFNPFKLWCESLDCIPPSHPTTYNILASLVPQIKSSATIEVNNITILETLLKNLCYLEPQWRLLGLC